MASSISHYISPRTALATEYVVSYYTSDTIGHVGYLPNILSDGYIPLPISTFRRDEMTASNAIEQTKNITNGVDVGEIMDLISAIESDTGYARFSFGQPTSGSMAVRRKAVSRSSTLVMPKILPANSHSPSTQTSR